MNLNKILLLNNRQWRENNRIYRIGLLAITGILLFLFLIVWHWRDSFSGDSHRGIFLIVLFAGGCIFASSLLKDLAHPSRGMWLMGIPASAPEKILITIVYASVFYTLAYVCIFILTEGFFLWMIKQDGATLARTDLMHNGFYNFGFTFVNFQLLILLGCLSFKKGALLKTILIMIVYISVSNSGNNYLLTKMTGQKGIDGGALYSYFQFRHEGENVYVNLPPNAEAIATAFFNYILPLTLCYIIYLKFRETEI